MMGKAVEMLAVPLRRENYLLLKGFGTKIGRVKTI